MFSKSVYKKLEILIYFFYEFLSTNFIFYDILNMFSIHKYLTNTEVKLIMTSLDNLHIKSEYERLIYVIDPLWQIGRSVPTRKDHIYNRSLFYNKKFVCRFCDEDFHVFEKIYDYIVNEGDDNHVVIKERLRLGLISPETVTDKTFRKEIIRKGLVTKEQAKQYYPEEYSYYYHDKSEPLFITREYPIAIATDPYEPELGLQTYYKTPYGWTDEQGNVLDFRKSCKSTWDMRKMVAMQQATLEDAFYYSEGTCLEVFGDIVQHVLTTHIIPALYKVSEDAKVRKEQTLNKFKYNPIINAEDAITYFFDSAITAIETASNAATKMRRFKQFHYTACIKQLLLYVDKLLNTEGTQLLTETDDFKSHIATLKSLDDSQATDENLKIFKQFYDWCAEQFKVHTDLFNSFKEILNTEIENIDQYINIHNKIKDDITLLHAILTTNDSIIVKALTLPYTTGEQSFIKASPKIQTYREFVYELQCRIYKIMSATPKLVGFTYDRIATCYKPEYSHKQKINNQAAEFMNLVIDIMTFNSSGYEAHLRYLKRQTATINREHKRFSKNHTEPYIPYFAEKRKKLNTCSLMECALFIAQYVNDLRDMGWRAIKKSITAFNYKGVRYQLDCDTLKLTAWMPACHKDPMQLYQIVLDYHKGEITATDVAKLCKDPLLVQKITAEKNSIYTRIVKTFNGKQHRLRTQLKEKYPEKLTREMWNEIDYQLTKQHDSHLRGAIFKHLRTDCNSIHGYELFNIADAKVQQFNDWVSKQTKLLKDLYQRSQARYRLYRDMVMPC